MTGKELKYLRESVGLTQTQLAKMCGLSSGNVITNYESDGKKGSRNITKPMEILFKMIIEKHKKDDIGEI